MKKKKRHPICRATQNKRPIHAEDADGSGTCSIHFQSYSRRPSSPILAQTLAQTLLLVIAILYRLHKRHGQALVAVDIQVDLINGIPARY